MSTFPTHRKDEFPPPPPPPSPISTRPAYPTSPLTHIFILTSVLVPIALVPYLAVRRHLLRLHTQMARMNETNVMLQRDLKAALTEASVRREEQERVKVLVEGMRRDVEGMRRGVERKGVEGEGVRRVVKDLWEEKQRTRLQLREVGKSLADVAAFMHEVEIQQGLANRPNDGRGIERIRQLAYKLFDSLQKGGLKTEAESVKVDNIEETKVKGKRTSESSSSNASECKP
ncbi:hypothetical protein EUX98_g619 [Antrodiella citrinella]|uniref:Uncharacterized protein n=1 Tax=Antrodiella citrinella TaxID=2447956 RepID=A0A4S4N3U4_9APHY|nr:hypothetical protein EUX98_g619 [Antrodiella citrinella]